ncbi:MAG TPA: orotate phosphoribosyltransferase-like protein [Thermoplasmataceae archaeon]|nr:orotate phosphoribosyltransferase-like protein [Thermoplasmatales archaeon AK]HLH86748.1 orotate phosphoribosyltransferase-like protein [Thermoplasmataceae archaeon]
MKSIEELYKRALELKNKGMSDKEISTELHLSVGTVTWLLSKEFVKEPRVQDVKIGWRTIGINGDRIRSVSEVITDIIDEESQKGDFEVDAVLGITINGIPFATMVSYIYGKELIVYRPHPSRKEGFFSSNFASVKDKNIVIIDDVMSTGETMKRAIMDVKNEGGKPVLCVVLASKMKADEILGVRVRSLLRTVLVGGE